MVYFFSRQNQEPRQLQVLTLSLAIKIYKISRVLECPNDHLQKFLHFQPEIFFSIENDIMVLEVLPKCLSTAGIFYSVTHIFDSGVFFELRCLIKNVHDYS